MAAVRKGVALTFGLLSTTGSTYSAIEKPKTGNKQVCTGFGSDDDGNARSHDVIPITQQTTCTECGPVPFAAIRKAQPVGDGWVILHAEELAEARADATQFQKRVDLTPHPVEAVEQATLAGDKLYHLVPDPGHESTYALLATFIGAHPELAFMGQYAPRSSAGQYRVTVRDGILVLQERARQENVKATPQVDLPEVPDAYLAMAEQVLTMPGIVSEYDPATYADKYAEKIAALVATKSVVPGAPTADAPATAATLLAGDPMAALQAMLASVTPITDAKAAPKKRAAKKATAKKATAGAA